MSPVPGELPKFYHPIVETDSTKTSRTAATLVLLPTTNDAEVGWADAGGLVEVGLDGAEGADGAVGAGASPQHVGATPRKASHQSSAVAMTNGVRSDACWHVMDCSKTVTVVSELTKFCPSGQRLPHNVP